MVMANYIFVEQKFIQHTELSNFEATIFEGDVLDFRVETKQDGISSFETELTKAELKDWAITGKLEKCPRLWHQVPPATFLKFIDKYKLLHKLGIDVILS